MSISSSAPTFASLARRAAPASGSGDSGITQAVGEAFVQRMLNDITGGAANQVGQLRDVIGVVKDLDEVQSTRRGRQRSEVEALVEELDDLRAEIRKARRGGGDDGGGMNAVLLKGLLDQQAQAEERWQKMLERQEERDKIYREELKQAQDQSANNFFAKMGFESMMGRLNSDPLQEWERQYNFWSERVGDGAKATRDERAEERAERRWEREQEFLLKQQEIAAKYGQEDKESTKRTENVQSLATIAAALLGGGVPPVEPGAAVPGAGPAAGVFRFNCPTCGNEFAVPDPSLARLCPNCGTALVRAPETP